MEGCPLCGGLTVTEECERMPRVGYRIDYDGGDRVLEVALTSGPLEVSLIGMIHANFCPECGKSLA